MKTKGIKSLTIFLIILLSGCSIRLIPSRLRTRPQKQKGTYHRVKKGENLYRISLRYGVSVEAIKKANRLRSDRLDVGQRLLIPKGVKTKRIQIGKIEKKRSIVIAEKGDFLWPAKGEIIRKFGEGNDGINILLSPETKIIASKKGKVSFCGSTKSYGMTIVIDHQDGYYSIYAHEIIPQVEKGKIVSQGATIARIKSKEETFLHFEIRRGTEPVDPLTYLGD